MALMKFREPNHVKRVGVRPAHDGTQIFTRGNQLGAGENIFYTVPAGKTFHLTYYHVSSRLSAAVAAEGGLVIYDSTPALWQWIVYHEYDVAGHQVSFLGYTFPLEIPAGYTLRNNVSHANMDCLCIIVGWTE